MINKIIAFTLLPLMVIALVLSLVGIEHVSFDNTYMNFIKSVANDLDKWKFTIPTIPEITAVADVGGGIFQVINVLIEFFNAFIRVLNILIQIINVVINLIQFMLTLIYSVLNFRDTLAVGGVALSVL